MVWYGEKILDPVSIIDGSKSTCFNFRLFIYVHVFWYQVHVFHDFYFAYLRHTNKQDGAKEEVLLIIRCISEFVNEI